MSSPIARVWGIPIVPERNPPEPAPWETRGYTVGGVEAYLEEIEDEFRGIAETPLAQREDMYSHLAYIEENFDTLLDYAQERYADVDEPFFSMRISELLGMQPAVVRSVIDNHTLNDDERIAECMMPWKTKESLIALFIGGRGSWKTNTAWGWTKLAMEATGREVYSDGDPEKLPPFANHVDDMEDAPPGSIVFKEELAVDEGSRSSSGLEGRHRPAIMNTLRHKRQHLIGITQTTKIADNVWFETADYFFIKPLGLVQKDTERGAMRRYLYRMRELLPSKEWETYVHGRYSPPRRFTMPVPSFFTQNLSHTHSQIPTMTEAVHKAIALRRGRKSPGFISNYMAARGWRGSSKWWLNMIKRANGGEDPMDGA